MTIEKARSVGPSKLDIAYERLGDPGHPPVLLIMGLGAQLVGWPDGFCDALLTHKLHLIRFDNRDAGESTHLHDAPAPNFMAAIAGDFSGAPYKLSDMAADTVGLVDALDLPSVHLVGASMGGFIAQTIAIEHPTRVRSLTSIMSTTGSRSVGQVHPEAMALFTAVPVTTREQVIERSLNAFRVIGSPAYPADTDALTARAGRAFDRSYDPSGVVRQGVAVLASGDRTEKLRVVDVPTLVIHGTADKMCDVSGGRATAEAIPGAELALFEGMGHDLPKTLWPEMATKIATTVARGEARGQ